MKIFDFLILGGITAGILAFGKKANVAGIGTTKKVYDLDWFLFNRHKLNKKHDNFEVHAFWKQKNREKTDIVKKNGVVEYNNIVDVVAYIDILQREGKKVDGLLFEKIIIVGYKNGMPNDSYVVKL